MSARGETLLWAAQRASAALLALCVTVHLATILYAVQGGGHAWPGALLPGNVENNGVTSRNLSANDAIMRFVGSVPAR